VKRQRENLSVQQWVVFIALLLFAIKITAWYITRSMAILTDALESTVNVIAALIGWYSLYISAQPKDRDHPYGHGKAEFLSAAVEGTLIILAGLIIIYESILHLIDPQPIHELEKGFILILITAGINFITGWLSIRKGKKNHSLALIASGKHLQTDTYTTLGIIAGLIVIYTTGLTWIDSVVALLLASFILYTGYGIIRASIAGIMDEADKELLENLVKVLNRDRKDNWIDIHNLRVIKYGGHLHIDCHLTVPWYLNVHQAHREIDQLSSLISNEFGDRIELFVHSDGCMDFSCRICRKKDCTERKNDFVEEIQWTTEHLLSDSKHRLH
jgi:cation diffusion facilitator family transporter